MDPITLGLLIGAGGGLLKSVTVDKAREDRQRKLAAATQRYSPWTQLQAQPIQEADPFGSTLGYGGLGADQGQKIQNAQANNALVKAQTSWLNNGGSPQYTAGLNQSNPWGSYGPKASPLGLPQKPDGTYDWGF